MEQGDLLMGNQAIVTLEFNGEDLKVTVRYYCVPPKTKVKVILTIKTYKPDHESKKFPQYDHSDYSGDSDDECHSSWEVECPFAKIQEFFSDEWTKIIIDDVQEKVSDEDEEEVSHEDEDEDSDEQNPDPLIGSVYLCYSEANVESRSLLAPREIKGILVFNISNTKPSDNTEVAPSNRKHKMCHKV